MAVSTKFAEIQQIKYDLFKSQNPETGRFDVIFELQGKRLYAHKTCLNLVSDTFESMLSDRWTSKDEPIKLKDYTFNEFYQFLTFLYSAQCQLTDTNIFSMVDIAEFYQVAIFKNYCDEYLSNMEFTVENIFTFMELAEKYSLDQLKAAAEIFVLNNFSNFINAESFMNLKKSEVEKFVIAYKEKVKPEDLFQLVYKWTEYQILSNTANITTVNQNDAIKSEISDFLSHINFNKMEMGFLLRYLVSRGFIFPSLDDISKILCDGYYKPLKVVVTNTHGQKLYGNIIPDQTVIEYLKTLKLSENQFCSSFIFWYSNCKIPSAPSPLQKRDGVKYLIWMTNYYIAVSHNENIAQNCYVLAEMMPEEGKEFTVTTHCIIEIK